MAKVYFTEKQLHELHDTPGAAQPAAYTIRAPLPQMFLVTTDAQTKAGGISVRTVTFSPLTWNPYTKAVSIPLGDAKVVSNLRKLGAQCVLALPSKTLLRQLVICDQLLPQGISEVDVARFTTCKSLHIDVPSIRDCPVNFECVVDHLTPYHNHLIAFLRVVGASIDAALLFLDRDEIVSVYPTNYADDIIDESGAVRRRVSLLFDLFPCPTFPVGPKRGWYGTFDIWMQDLFDESYLSREEYQQVAAWHDRWQAVFPDLRSPERAKLRENLTDLVRLIAHERWDELHTFLAGSKST